MDIKDLIFKKSGIEETEVVIVDFEEEKEKALCITMNKVSGQWDYGLLADIMEELRNSEIDTAITGFSGNEITELLGELQEMENNIPDVERVDKKEDTEDGIADWIIEEMPAHHSYVEPFFGSGAVFFNKPLSNIETINDLDGEVVNFFEIIRDMPEKLAAKIYMTPYARVVYENVYKEFCNYNQSKLDRDFKFCIKKAFAWYEELIFQ